ncbi:MAG: toxin-antitoxin system HicB family antitoxin [Acidimicrobiaceae bacterium]|jgi:hypothetical protein|nr:toxin-antitoxin system HicB family antitoxin [Acidimicrobiaceae bacterium]|tara:strand:- start:18208 stop:18405 length:198 start_codon:yes stop_codon:yes gene_type:complete
MRNGRKQFPLRLSEDLYRAYEKWAGDEFRSVNAQIEAVLSEAVQKAGRSQQAETSDINNTKKGKL